jgi:hypothetical protein
MHRDVVPLPSSPTGAARGRNLVCVIGIDRYPRWPVLHNARRDAERIRALFAELGFADAAPPLLDTAATREAIDRLVKDDLARLGLDDSLVVFFAGHGHTAVQPHSRTGYLIPCDGDDSDGKVSSWIDVEAWLFDIAKLPPRHILVVLDSCHSGIALESVRRVRGSGRLPAISYEALRRRRSRRVIASAMDDQLALDSGPVEGHSLFAGGLIDALTTGGDRLVTGIELALQVQRYVMRHEPQQTPGVGSFDLHASGEMVIALGAGTEPAGDGARQVGGRRTRSAPRSLAIAGAALMAAATIATLSATPVAPAVPPDAGAVPVALVAAAPLDAMDAPGAAPDAGPRPPKAASRRRAARLDTAAASRDDAVFAAVAAHDTTGVVTLLLGGASPDARGVLREKGSGASLRVPALSSAAHDCHLPLVQALLQHGAATQTGATVEGAKPWTNGTTPLLFAAMRCRGREGAAVVGALVRAGARIDGSDDAGRTALHVVKDRLVARALLAAGAAIEAPAHSGATPLLEAARNARRDVVGVLLDAGARPGATTTAGETGLWLASAARPNRTLDPARDQIITRLARAGVPIDDAPAGAGSPLAQALARGADDRAVLLLDLGAHVAPLLDAITTGAPARVAALCAAGYLARLPSAARAKVAATCAQR